MKKYIVRLDDACPTMNRGKWDAVEGILDKNNIKPIVAVIPQNKDSKMKIDNVDDGFWNKVKAWQQKGWNIALHGFDHCYISNSPGIIPINKKSEFAGVDFQKQSFKIRDGINVLKNHGINAHIWVAPSHTFDDNTLKALYDQSDIRIISDGIAFCPYNEKGFFWIPQQNWGLEEKKSGIWTSCFHPNTMSDDDIKKMAIFCSEHKKEFINDVNNLLEKYKNRKRSAYDIFYFYKFFLKRRLNKIKNNFKV